MSKPQSVIGSKRKYPLNENGFSDDGLQSHKRFKPDVLPSKRNKEFFAVYPRTDTNLPLDYSLRPLPRLASHSS